MGHPGNWSERKVSAERRRNAAAACAAIRQAKFTSLGKHSFVALSPCATLTRFPNSTYAYAVCAGCMKRWTVPWEVVMNSRLSHQPWPEVMKRMRCTACASPPVRLEFEELSQPIGAILANIPTS